MRRFVIIIFLLLLCSLLALWSPWLSLNIDLASIFGVTKPNVISGLQVYSLSGDLEVFVDYNSKGKVNIDKSPLIIDKIVPGEHLITLKRLSNNINSYWSFSKLITFTQGTNVVLSYNLGPDSVFSEGEIIYAAKKQDETRDTQINITSNVTNINIQIDNISPQLITGNTYVTNLSISTQHKIKITKPHYDTLEFTILPETNEDRLKFKNYDINVEAQLMYQPLSVVN